jgi:hypothetical protein
MKTKPRNYAPILAATFIISVIYWITGNIINVYQNALVGGVYEVLWAPMIAALVLPPVVSLVLWYSGKRNGFPAKPYLNLRGHFCIIVIAAITA